MIGTGSTTTGLAGGSYARTLVLTPCRKVITKIILSTPDSFSPGTSYNDHRRSKSHPHCSPDCPSFNTSFAGRSATFTESVRATILYSRAHHRKFEFNQKDRGWLQKNNGTGNALNDHFVALWKAAPSFPSPLLHSVFSDGAIGPPEAPIGHNLTDASTKISLLTSPRLSDHLTVLGLKLVRMLWLGLWWKGQM